MKTLCLGIVLAILSGIASASNAQTVIQGPPSPAVLTSVNVQAYGAVGDGIELTNCAMTAGANTLTCTGASFAATDVGKSIGVNGVGAVGTHLTDGAITATQTQLCDASATYTSNDIGKTIYVVGAGAAGTFLQTTIASIDSGTCVELTVAASTTVTAASVYYIGSGGYQSWGTITGFTSSTVVTTSFNASTTNSGVVAFYGTDNHTAIQNAINSGLNVFFPGLSNSNFYLTTLRATNSSFNRQVLYGDGNTSWIVRIGNTTSGDLFRVAGVAGAQVTRLKLTPSPDYTQYSDGFAVHFVNVTGGWIDHNDCTLELHGCFAVDGGNGTPSTNVHVESNTIHDSIFNATTMANADAVGDIAFLNDFNNIEASLNILNKGTAFGLLAQGPNDANGVMTDFQFNNNQVRNVDGYCEITYEDNTTQTWDRWTASNNVCSNVTGNLLQPQFGYPYGTGMYDQGTEHGVITGNNVYNTHSGSGPFLSLLAPAGIGTTNVSDVTITGNKVRLDGFKAGILSQDPNQQGEANGSGVISGNTVESPHTVGILCADRDHCSITGNTVNAALSQCILYTRPSLTASLAFGIEITGNQVTGCGSSGIEVDYASAPVVTGNQIDNATTNAILFGNGRAPVASGNAVRNVHNSVGGVQIASTESHGAAVGPNSINCATGGIGYILAAGTSIVPGSNFDNCTPYSNSFGPVRTWTANATTLAVTGGITYLTANTSATTFSTATGANDGDTIVIVAKDSNTTINFSQATSSNNTFQGNNGINLAMTPGQQVRCVFSKTDIVWYCIVSEPYGGDTPTCGTGCASVTGNDRAMTVTSGTAVTAVTVNFFRTWAATPVCTVTTNSLTSLGDVSSVGTSSVTFGLSTALTGGALYVHCR